MLDLRKFPLIVFFMPFICGILLQYHFYWPFYVSAGLTAFSLLYLLLAERRFSLTENYRKLLLGFAAFPLGMMVFFANDYRFYSGNPGALLNKEVIVRGVVTERKDGLAGKQQLVVELRSFKSNDSLVSASGSIVISLSDGERIRTGDVVVVQGEITPFTNRNNPGEFDAVSFYRNKKISGHIFASGFSLEKVGEEHSLNRFFTGWRDYLSGLMEKELDGDFLGIAKALILGDKSDLDQEVMTSFSSTGSMHVLAVSGLHIGLILLLFQKVLGLFSDRITKRQGILIAIALIWLYGGLTGASPSVMRAVVMFTILSGGQLFRRQNHPINILILSALVLISFDPWMIFDLGFQLSYAAMIGIFLLYRPIVEAWSPANKIVRLGWEGTAVGIAATIVTTPLTLFWFYRFPNYFAIANLGVMVFGFAVLMMGLILLFTSWAPYLIKIVALLFSFSVVGLVYWVNWVDGLSGAVSGGFHLSSAEMLLAFALVFGWIVHLHKKWIHRYILLAASVALVGLWSYKRSEVMEMDQLVIFNDNRLCLALKRADHIVAFYDKRYNGSWKIPRELESYANYTGCSIRIIPWKHTDVSLSSGKTSFSMKKVKDGVKIMLNEKELFYRTNGNPDPGVSRGLMTGRIQLYARPDLPSVPFIMNY